MAGALPVPAAGPNMLVKADDREKRAGVVEALREHPGVTAETCRLLLGDYQVDDCVVFERKTLADFAASVVDGRVFRQVRRLAGSRFHAVMILEGGCRRMGDLGVSRAALQGALIAVSVVFGVPVLRSAGPQETAELIRFTAEQIERVGKLRVARPGCRPRDPLRRQAYLLEGLPGVGPERARRLLAHFGCVRDVMTASAGELDRVRGIGKKTAVGIATLLGEGCEPR